MSHVRLAALLLATTAACESSPAVTEPAGESDAADAVHDLSRDAVDRPDARDDDDETPDDPVGGDTDAGDFGDGTDLLPDDSPSDVGVETDAEEADTPDTPDTPDTADADDTSEVSDTTETPTAVCGDGVVDEGEECDDGDDNSDFEGGACRTDCFPHRCGDGVLDPDEDCEPIDGLGGRGCTVGCTPENGLLEREPDGTRRTARTLAADGVAHGNLDFLDRDCVRIARDAGDDLKVFVHDGVLGCRGNILLTVFAPDDSLVLSLAPPLGNCANTELEASAMGVAAGEWLVCVEGFLSQPVPGYTLVSTP